MEVGYWLTQGSGEPWSDAGSTEHRVTISPGAGSVTVAVSPPADSTESASNAVVMPLFGAAGYRKGTPFSSKAALDDGDSMP